MFSLPCGVTRGRVNQRGMCADVIGECRVERVAIRERFRYRQLRLVQESFCICQFARAVHVARLTQGDGLEGEHSSVAGMAREELVTNAKGRSRLSTCQKQIPEIHLRLRVVGIQLDGALVGRPRFVQATKLMHGVPEVHMAFGVVRSGSDGALVGVDGFVESLRLLQKHAEVVERIRVLGIDLQSFSVSGLGVVESRQLVGHGAHIVESIHIAWLDLQHPPVIVERLVELAERFERIARIEIRR